MKWLNHNTARRFFLACLVNIVLFDVRANAVSTWMHKSDMPTKRYQHSTNVVGGKIYVIGGWNTIGEWDPSWIALTRVDQYDPVTDTWTRKADMPTRRGYTSTCVVNDKIYVMGGDCGSEPIPTVEVYDPATDTWTEQTELPTKRWWFSTAVLDGIIYVIGGNINWEHLRTVETYDPVSDTWTAKFDMPTARSASSSCAVDGKIYVIGGGAPGKSAVEVYDPATDTWTRKADMPTARYLLDAVVVDGKIYAIGGWWFSKGGPIYSTVEIYDPATDTWTNGVDIPVTTAGFSTSVVNGGMYVMGGATATHDNNHWILTSAVYANQMVPSVPIVDFNGDGIVDAADMCIMVEHWGEDYSLCDIGPTLWGDSVVDIEDLKVLAEHLFREIDDPTLLAHWALDETEGATAVDCISGNMGFVMGYPAWRPEGGVIGGAIELDGVDDCVVTGRKLNTAEGPFSTLAWVKGGAPGQVVISQAVTSNLLTIDASDGTLMTEFNDSDGLVGPIISDAIVTDGDWHRIGLVWDGISRKLYVDSVVVAQDIPASLEGHDCGLYIGVGKGYSAGTFFSGLIDDVRIYNRTVKP